MTAGATETFSSPMNTLPEGRPTQSIVSVMSGLVATKSETECAPHVAGDCGGFGERLTDRVDGGARLDRSVTVVAAVDAGAVAQTQIIENASVWPTVSPFSTCERPFGNLAFMSPRRSMKLVPTDAARLSAVGVFSTATRRPQWSTR